MAPLWLFGAPSQATRAYLTRSTARSVSSLHMNRLDGLVVHTRFVSYMQMLLRRKLGSSSRRHSVHLPQQRDTNARATSAGMTAPHTTVVVQLLHAITSLWVVGGVRSSGACTVMLG